jgi:CheY-like chemotaxis protein
LALLSGRPHPQTGTTLLNLCYVSGCPAKLLTEKAPAGRIDLDVVTGTAPKGHLENRRILVVEDEYLLADDMAQVLANMGANIVGPVPTKDRALALILSGEPLDAAVLDINLRGETVFPVADALTARAIPFVFATGYAQTSIPAAYQAVPRWEKPFNPDELASVLCGTMNNP